MAKERIYKWLIVFRLTISSPVHILQIPCCVETKKQGKRLDLLKFFRCPGKGTPLGDLIVKTPSRSCS